MVVSEELQPGKLLLHILKFLFAQMSAVVSRVDVECFEEQERDIG